MAVFGWNNSYLHTWKSRFFAPKSQFSSYMNMNYSVETSTNLSAGGTIKCKRLSAIQRYRRKKDWWRYHILATIWISTILIPHVKNQNHLIQAYLLFARDPVLITCSTYLESFLRLNKSFSWCQINLGGYSTWLAQRLCWMRTFGVEPPNLQEYF